MGFSLGTPGLFSWLGGRECLLWEGWEVFLVVDGGVVLYGGLLGGRFGWDFCLGFSDIILLELCLVYWATSIISCVLASAVGTGEGVFNVFREGTGVGLVRLTALEAFVWKGAAL